jgi:hypothetical protein
MSKSNTLGRGNAGADCAVSGFNMKHFDALPKSLRAALRDADQNWNCTQIHKALRRGVRLNGTVRRYKAAELIDVIRAQDKAMHERTTVGVMPGQR